METQWWETVTSMQAGFLWEDFWNHGSDGYATVLVQLHFISIKKGLLKPMHHPGEALCCSLCLEQVQQKEHLADATPVVPQAICSHPEI